MSDTTAIVCHRCARPLRQAIYLDADGSAGQQGPFGRECARLVTKQLAEWNIAVTRRRVRA